MNAAPERDVVRVEELKGPRGGRTLVLYLSCGCFLTRSSRLPPPKRARCTPCAVLANISPVDPLADLSLEERQLLGGRITIAAREREAARELEKENKDRIARKLVTIFHLYRGYKVESRGPAGCIMDVLDIVAPEIANEVRELGEDATYEKHWSHV